MPGLKQETACLITREVKAAAAKDSKLEANGELRHGEVKWFALGHGGKWCQPQD